MTNSLKINPSETALLIIDYQKWIVSEFVAEKDELLKACRQILARARQRDMLVVYIVTAFREGYPEVSSLNPIFSDFRANGYLQEGTRGAAIHRDIGPGAGEVMIAKRRTGAFAGTELDILLRAHGINTIVLCGIATSGCILSTVRSAADMDYRIIVVRDCCSDLDRQVHGVLMDKVFVSQGSVIGVDEFCDAG